MSALAGVRSILETPILDERKWAKVPSIACDAVLLDLEDSVPPERKEAARERVLEELGRSEYLRGRLPLPRANALDTPWGEDDLRALAAAGAGLIAYPKANDVEELRRVRELTGPEVELVPIVETARAVIELEAIAREAGVAGLMFGPYDLAIDAGWSGPLHPDAFHYPRSKLSLVGSAYELPVYDMVFVDDLRDLAAVRAAALRARELGFDGMATFYPPHVDAINEVFTPSPDEVSAADEVVSAYESALAGGAAALQSDGRALIVQDYKRARRVLERADRRER